MGYKTSIVVSISTIFIVYVAFSLSPINNRETILSPKVLNYQLKEEDISFKDNFKETISYYHQKLNSTIHYYYGMIVGKNYQEVVKIEEGDDLIVMQNKKNELLNLKNSLNATIQSYKNKLNETETKLNEVENSLKEIEGKLKENENKLNLDNEILKNKDDNKEESKKVETVKTIEPTGLVEGVKN